MGIGEGGKSVKFTNKVNHENTHGCGLFAGRLLCV